MFSLRTRPQSTIVGMNKGFNFVGRTYHQKEILVKRVVMLTQCSSYPKGSFSSY